MRNALSIEQIADQQLRELVREFCAQTEVLDWCAAVIYEENPERIQLSRLQDPDYAQGFCGAVSHRLVEALQAAGYNMSCVVRRNPKALGLAPKPGLPASRWGAGARHCEARVFGDDGEVYRIDLTAAQYGVSVWPLIRRSNDLGM